MKMVMAQGPRMVVCSPGCRAPCTSMALGDARSRNPEAIRKARAKAVTHLEFMVKIYYEHVGNGR